MSWVYTNGKGSKIGLRVQLDDLKAASKQYNLKNKTNGGFKKIKIF